MMATYFFLSDIKTVHVRKVYNLFDLLSSLGGMIASLMGVGTAIGTYINKQLFITKMLQDL